MYHRGDTFDETETMPWNAEVLDTETEELYARQICEEPQKIRTKKKRTKGQIQHCPSCHCPAQTVEYSSGKTKYSDNVEPVMNGYEHFHTEPIYQPIRKSQSSPLSPRPCTCDQMYRHAKQRHPDRRKDRKNRHEAFVPVYRNVMNSSAVNDSTEGCCGYLHPSYLKNTRTEGHWRDDASQGYYENSESDSPEKYFQDYHRSKKPTKTDVGPRKPTTDRSRSKSKGKHTERKEEPEWWQQLELNDLEQRKFLLELLDRCDPRKTEPRVELVGEDQEEANCGRFPLQTTDQSKNGPPGNTNIKELIRNKTSSTMEASDFSKDEDAQKLFENCKPPSLVGLKGAICKSNEDSTPNREELREVCEMMMTKERNQETTGKNVYGAGDVDLCATKSHIIGVIDRALSNEFGVVSDQQKITDTKRGSTQEEICVEITRALHEDCCVQDLTSGHVDRLKQLKMLRWEHLNHIQEEFRKLCSLEKFLDSCSSPRQSLPMLQQQQRQQTGEMSDEQRMKEEKQELTQAT